VLCAAYAWHDAVLLIVRPRQLNDTAFIVTDWVEGPRDSVRYSSTLRGLQQTVHSAVAALDADEFRQTTLSRCGNMTVDSSRVTSRVVSQRTLCREQKVVMAVQHSPAEI